MSENLETIFPQVGALLHWNGGSGDPELKGGPDWVLKGSCTLVGRNRVLAVSHTLSPHHNMYVFFPSVGLVPVLRKPQREKKMPARFDYLALLAVPDQGAKLSPIRPKKVYKFRGQRYTKGVARHAVVCGFGSWPGFPGCWPRYPKGTDGSHGLQRRWPVKLLPDEYYGADNYDTLDLIWQPDDDLPVKAGSLNSGGPMLWRETDNDDDVLIGVHREQNGANQIGAWIGRDRYYKWLKPALGGASRGLEKVASPPLGVRPCRLLKLGPEDAGVYKFSVTNLSDFRATLNATAGFDLQMGVFPSRPNQRQLTALKENHEAAGRFLVRTPDQNLPTGTRDVFVAVTRYRHSPVLCDEVLAQLCVSG